MWLWVRELLIIIASALLLSLIIKTFFFQSFWIPSESMEDTLVDGDRILVTKWRPGPLELRHGDIVVFKDPNNWLRHDPADDPTGLHKVGNEILTFTGLLPEDAGEHLIKRVVGLPGDTVTCTDPEDKVHVNGTAIDEPYIKPGTEPCGREFEITVPDGYLWVMGDNRDNSADSRAHMGEPGGGTIPIDNVVGTTFAVVWPLSNWTGLGNPFTDATAPPPPVSTSHVPTTAN
ncbi:signal peptidase I [Demequina oxidasica]|uniref:signal peptidase I n=1 Tax=Demequina oxidasica TaxID=676199 RepID=UPI0007828CF7|nr:signal peptidase I [Demequina oxidasica]